MFHEDIEDISFSTFWGSSSKMFCLSGTNGVGPQFTSCFPTAESWTSWTGQLCESLLPKLTSATKAANPKNRWSLMVEGNKRDICQTSDNLSTYSTICSRLCVKHCRCGAIDLNYLLWGVWQQDESRDYMLCELTFLIHCHPHASPSRPHFEPGHVTARSALLFIWYKSGLNCWKART